MSSAEYATYRTTRRLVPIEHSNPVECVLSPDVQRVLDRPASSTDMLTTSEEGRNANMNRELARCLKKGPVLECYGPGQDLANHLLYSGSNGIVYPSVRNPGGTSIVCFRPALVYNVRRSAQYKLSISSGISGWT
jgi:hypothetical protein